MWQVQGAMGSETGCSGEFEERNGISSVMDKKTGARSVTQGRDV